MPLLHMETDMVRGMGQQLQTTTESLSQQTETLNHSLYNLQNNWYGTSSDFFAQELNGILHTLRQIVSNGSQLSQRLQREVAEWEETGRHLGITTIETSNTDGSSDNWITNDGTSIGFMLGGDGGPAIWGNMVLGSTTGVTGHSQGFLLHGQKIDLALRYREGQMSLEELIENWAEMEKSLQPDYVKTDWTLYQISKGEAEAGIAAWQDSYSGKYGNWDVSALSAEIGGSHDIKLGKDGLSAKLEGQAGVYLAHAEYDTEVAGVDVAAEGYVGAQANGEADFAFNPLAGTAVASVGLSGFVGGRVDASANKELNVGGVKADVGARGSLSYGLGGKFDAEVGVDDGVFKADVDIGATIGLGGEIGFSVELDVQDAAESVVDAGRDALDWIF